MLYKIIKPSQKLKLILLACFSHFATQFVYFVPHSSNSALILSES